MGGVTEITEREDQIASILHYAHQFNLIMTKNGDNVRMDWRDAQVGDPPGFDIIRERLAASKPLLMAALEDPDVIRKWLSRAQESLINRYDSWWALLERWDAVESMLRVMHPTDTRCISADGKCIDHALVRCQACVNRPKETQT